MQTGESYEEGEALLSQGEYEAAFRQFEAGVTAYEAISPSKRILCLSRIAALLRLQGETLQAEQQARKAVQEAERLADPEPRSAAFRCFGDLLGAQGQDQDAESWLRKAVAELDHSAASEIPVASRSFIQALCALGKCLRVQGKSHEAETYLERACGEAAQSSDLTIRILAFRSWGMLLQAQGRDAEAELWLTRAADEANDSQVTDPLARYNAFSAVGEILRVQGNFSAALDYLDKAAREASKLPFPAVRCECFNAYGDVLRVQERFQEAELWLRRATDELGEDRVKDPLTRCNVSHNIGQLLLHDPARKEEAGTWLGRAAIEAEKVSDPLTQCEVAKSLGMWALAAHQPVKALGYLWDSRTHLLEALRVLRRPEGIANFLTTQGNLFELGRDLCGALWAHSADKDPELLWLGLAMTDSAKCVSIREGLRRYGHRAADQERMVSWQAGPADVSSFFLGHTAEGVNIRPTRAVLRGVRKVSARPAQPICLELPEEVESVGRQQFCDLPGRDGIKRLLPDPETVLVVFSFDQGNDDLVVMPIRLNETTRVPEIRVTDRGYFRIEGIGASLRTLVAIQDDLLDCIHSELNSSPAQSAAPASSLNRRHGMVSVYRQLYDLLKVRELLGLIETDEGKWSDLHLVLIPDGILYQFPLHAARCTATGLALYEQVASVRYGLSLQTLELQQQIEDTAAAPLSDLRGVAFAHPDRNGTGGGFLPGVVHEAEGLARGVPHERGGWWVHGEIPVALQASRENLRQRHQAGNVLWYMGHGGRFSDRFMTKGRGTVEVEDYPGVLLSDGPVSVARMFEEGYDFSHVELLHFSACLLGELATAAQTKEEVEGFIAALTLLRSRRVVSSMWVLSDEVAVEFARHWSIALVNSVFQPDRRRHAHAFSLAFKEALTHFRQAEEGRFDHEFYWAPYLLYGLG